MSSGKQLSFSAGEVSPMERYKAGSVTYESGLNKLRNMYVRRGGGVSNIPGTVIDKVYVPETEEYNKVFRVDTNLHFDLDVFDPNKYDEFYRVFYRWVGEKNRGGKVAFRSIKGLDFIKVVYDPTLSDKIQGQDLGSIEPVLKDDVKFAVIIRFRDRRESLIPSGYFAEGQSQNLIFRSFKTEAELLRFDLAQIDVIKEANRYIITPSASADRARYMGTGSHGSTTISDGTNYPVGFKSRRGILVIPDDPEVLYLDLGSGGALTERYGYLGFLDAPLSWGSSFLLGGVGGPSGAGFQIGNGYKALWASGVQEKDIITAARWVFTAEGPEGIENVIKEIQTQVTRASNSNTDLGYGVFNPETTLATAKPPRPGTTNLYTISTSFNLVLQGYLTLEDFKIRAYRSNSIIDPDNTESQGMDYSKNPLAGFIGEVTIGDMFLDSSSNMTKIASITDYGSVDLSYTAPTDESMIYKSSDYSVSLDNTTGEWASGMGGLPSYSVDSPAGIVGYHACKYQGRLIVAPEPFTRSDRQVVAGEILASKLGCVLDFKAPQISSDVGAFRFSVPVDDGTPVVAVMEFNKLLAFTEKGVYAFMGGDGGGLTPSGLNPRYVYGVGCSLTIKPKKLAHTAFYISYDHLRLIAIRFSEDVGLQVQDISSTFSHLLKESEAVMLLTISEVEDSVYILRLDGKIIQVSVNVEGDIGSSLLDLGIEVKDIYEHRVEDLIKPKAFSIGTEVKRKVLGFSGIKNGMIVEGHIPFREDEDHRLESYALSIVSRGFYLKDTGTTSGKVEKLTSISPDIGEPTDPDNDSRFNISAVNPGEYEAGELLEVYITNFSTPTSPIKISHIKFSFGDEEGIFTITSWDTNAGTNYDMKATGTLDIEVPQDFQDPWGVNGPDPSSQDMFLKSTGFLPMITTLEEGTGSSDFEVGELVALAFMGLDSEPFYYDENDNIVLNHDYPVQVPVSVVGDGQVLSSPLNPNKDTLYLTLGMDYNDTVANKLYAKVSLELPHPCALVKVGLPMVSEFETLEIEAADARTLTSGNKLITAAGVGFVNTRGGFMGSEESAEQGELEEIQFRDNQDLGAVDENFSGVKDVYFAGNYNRHGRVLIRNVDPVPISIVSVYPKGITSGDD